MTSPARKNVSAPSGSTRLTGSVPSSRFVSAASTSATGTAPRVRRSKSGCLTCRLRKKRCDETRPICATCKRLGIECLGFSERRPERNRKKEHVMTDSPEIVKSDAWTSTSAKISLYLSTIGALKSQRGNPLAQDVVMIDGDGSQDIIHAPVTNATTDNGVRVETRQQQSSPSQVNNLNSAGRWEDPTSFLHDLSTLLTGTPISPLSGMFNDGATAPGSVSDSFSSVSHGQPVTEASGVGLLSMSLSTQSPPNLIGPWQPSSDTPSTFSDRDLLILLGLSLPNSNSPQMTLHSQENFQPQGSFFPLLCHPSTDYGTTFFSTPGTSGIQSADMRYLHHYLNVVMPYQWIFERGSLSDIVAPLAFTDPNVFESLTALAALHIARKRRQLHPMVGTPSSVGPSVPFQLPSPARITAVPDIDSRDGVDDTDPDLIFAKRTLEKNIKRLKTIPPKDFGSQEMAVATIAASSFHLFNGGNGKGWRDAVDLCRRCLAAVWRESQSWSYDDNASSTPNISVRVEKLSHLLSPLVWTDILTSVTQGVSSEFISLYRFLLLDNQDDGQMGKLLRENVMGCDSTTRLAIAETIALSEWKDKAVRMNHLSIRDMMERVISIERLLGERRWRERHLFESEDVATLQRRAVSDVFFHGARVLLATTLNGPFPGVLEVASAVQDTADAFHALDSLNLEGADRALVFPTVIAGCHTDDPKLQQIFRDRFEKLGEDAVAFGNTRNALRLMKEVWKRRALASLPSEVGPEVHWRKVMFEMDEEGLLLI